MAAGQAAAAAAAAAKAEARFQGPRAADYADMEVDAVSALEMLAAAAATTQQEEGPSHRKGRSRDP
jgi:transketolase C-terminal domain/subunit